MICILVVQHVLVQGSGTYGSRARCGSFDDCIWLSHIKLEFEKTSNFSSSSDVAPPFAC